MKRTLALCLGFILVRPLLLAPGQAEKTALRFGPAAGTALTYGINGQVNVGGKDFFGKDLTLDASAQGDLRLTVLNTGRDGVLAGLTTSGIEVRAQLPGESQSQSLRTAEGRSLEVVFNRSGKVMDIRNPDVLAQQNVLNFSIPQILRDYFPVFPAEPVGPGDQWRESRRLTVPFQGLELQINLVIDYTLNDIMPSPDGRKALISAVYTVAVSGSRDLGETIGVFEGKGQGTGYLNFLVDAGYFTEYRLDFKVDAAFVSKKGTKRLLEMPFTFSVLAEVNLIGNQRP
ncbi:MAG TPA: hypothetical protein VMS75_05530 [Terriglobales bacterium]|nr:hypothetical protein [Terriglobales bacterium]